MHPAQQQFVQRVQNLFPHKFLGVDVLDVGSMDINGNNRHYFDLKSYIGLDVGPGKNVDQVYEGQFLPFDSEKFDVVISTECMEHNEHFKTTISEMWRVLKPNGLMIFTCAGVDRPEHGTKDKDPVASPHTHDYYRNVSIEDIADVLPWEKCFFPYCFEYSGAYDFYFYGVKRI